MRRLPVFFVPREAIRSSVYISIKEGAVVVFLSPYVELSDN